MKELKIRKALKTDLEAIVRLLADDELGQERENYQLPLSDNYYSAFDRIENDPNALLLVAEVNDQIAGTLQINFLFYLTHQGKQRAQIEAVRVDKNFRGQTIGRTLFEYAINLAREQGCHLLQLTTDKTRSQAIGFYKKLGFVATHEGMKLYLGEANIV